MKKIPYSWLLFGPYVAFALGFLLNGIVVFVNGHHMPVFPPGGDCSLIDPDDIVHVCANSHTHLKVLADFIVTNNGTSSIGDMLMDALSITQIPFLIAWVSLVFRDTF
jgi:Family of unknown function (DUF5317)